MKLRPYQQQAVDAALDAFRTHRSALLVCPTGGGKTVIFSHIIDRMATGRAMVLAHRKELIEQAAQKIEAVTGQTPDIEMAHLRADSNPFSTKRIVVGSVQTQRVRMGRFQPSDFNLLVIDEAHRAASSEYRKVISYYRQNPNLKILGVTATPKRADEAGLGGIFETCPFQYEIVDAINDGWLVDIHAQMVKVNHLDLTDVKTTAGDLNEGQLAKRMNEEKVLHEIALPTSEIVGSRKALVFCANVDHASQMSEVLRRYGCRAEFIHGKMTKPMREQVLARFQSGETRMLCNVGVLTEGFDAPDIDCVVLARPTKSLGLFTQMVGRGTRPLPGVVDIAGDRNDRLSAIANSAKPRMHLIDFYGNSGQHKLVRITDVLGGRSKGDVKSRVARKMQNGYSGSVLSMMDEEERQIQEMMRKRAEKARESLIGKGSYAQIPVSIFANRTDIKLAEPPKSYKGRPATESQLSLLAKLGCSIPDGLTMKRAGLMIDNAIRARKSGPPSEAQRKVLSRYGYVADTFEQAGQIITRLKENGWKKLEAARG